MAKQDFEFGIYNGLSYPEVVLLEAAILQIAEKLGIYEQIRETLRQWEQEQGFDS